MPKRGDKKPPLRGLAERDALVMANFKLSHHMFKKMSRIRCVKRLGQEDASQAGFLALIRAAEQWDPKRGIAFSTYACNAIWKAIMDACSQDCPIPCNKANRRKGIFPPLPKGLPHPRDIAVDKVYVQCDPDRAGRLDLDQACSCLPKRWQQILHEVYHNDATFEKTGAMLGGISRERVRQIRNDALDWLREYFDGKRPRKPRDISENQTKGDAA